MRSSPGRLGLSPCPLCGGNMHDSTGGCTSCALHSGCAMLCCERCGYTTVAPQSKTVNFFKRLFRRNRPQGATAPPPGPGGVAQAPNGSDRTDAVSTANDSTLEVTRASRIPNPTEG